MKCLCAAVLVVFLSMCVLHCTAHPYAETRVQETGESVVQAEELQQTSSTADETNPLVLSRTKRHLQGPFSMCRYCCKCCRNKGCGYCCKF
ncbi:hypothetical protein AGOR_G00119730 [Albula goreensis]|uniref:Hepcidin n=1 Tax=Albula goreensis TaxID=1534307 RepID=A0A8T3DGA5_9TELE|nr:hypothetical protein AGOR_G00119730 [Albula goreensis]